MIVNSFDGGLNTRVDPSLIKANEAVLYENIDNEKLILGPDKGLLATEQTVTGYFYNFKGTWLSSTAERSYVEYSDVLYYTETNQPLKSNDGSRELTLGITGPEEAVTLAENSGGGTLFDADQVVQYVYTYYNSQDDIESTPSPVSDELSVTSGNSVYISNIVASIDIQVDKIKIYRVGEVTEFTLVMTVDNLSYSNLEDTVNVLDLPGNLLESDNNYVAPEGLKYLIEAYGIFFGAVGDKLYFSKIGEPAYWPPSYYIDFNDTLTGLLVVPEGILVFMETKTRIIVGTNVSEFAKLKVSDEQGCIAHLSCTSLKGLPMWLSQDGICAYYEGLISLISMDKLGKQHLSIVNTATQNEVYYICLSNGTILAYDARYGKAYKTFDFGQKIGNILNYNDTLYMRVGSNLVLPFQGEDLTFHYTSPVYTEGNHAQEKNYNVIYIRSNGDITFNVLIDGTQVTTKELNGNKIHEVTVPQEKQRGSNIQFDITGTGKVYEIDYKVVGRQNGR